MAAAAQVQLSYIPAGLKKAGCTGARFTPFTEDDWELAARITTGAAEISILQFMWFRTWSGKSQIRKGDSPPTYSEPLSYAQMAKFANCDRDTAITAVKAMIDRGVLDALDAETAEKLGLPVPAKNSKRQYRLRYEAWAKIPKPKAAPPPPDQDDDDDDEPEAAVAPATAQLFVFPGRRAQVKFTEPVSASSIKNVSTGAAVDFRQTGARISIVIRDANQELTDSAVGAHTHSAVAGAARAGARTGGVQGSPDFVNGNGANNGVTPPRVGLQTHTWPDRWAGEYWQLFVDSGKPLGQADVRFFLGGWKRITEAEKPAVVAWAREQFAPGGPWRTPEFTPFPGRPLINRGWERVAARSQKPDMAGELREQMRREGKLPR